MLTSLLYMCTHVCLPRNMLHAPSHSYHQPCSEEWAYSESSDVCGLGVKRFSAHNIALDAS